MSGLADYVKLGWVNGGAPPISGPNLDQMDTQLDLLTDELIGGADVASAATVTLAKAFHGITGTTTIDNISTASIAAGTKRSLWCKSALTIRNNGGGTGNLRTLTGADRVVKANEIVVFVYDGALWREVNPQGQRVTISAWTGGPPASPLDGDYWVATGVTSGDRWVFQYDAAWATDSYKWKFVGGADVLLSDDGTVNTSSTTYAIPTAGTGVVANTVWTASRSGLYVATHKCSINGSTGISVNVGLNFAGSGVNLDVVTGNAAEWRTGGGTKGGAVSSGSAIQPVYAVSSGSVTIQLRQLVIRPWRVI